jgi:hypothetical protein
MPKCSRIVCTVIGLASLLAYPGSVFAQRVTDTTFSTPVQLSGVLLPAGSYQFSLTRDGRSVVVSDAARRVVTTLAVIPISRAKRGDIVTMRPSAVAGGPPEVSALYSGGGTAGVEFVRREAQK